MTEDQISDHIDKSIDYFTWSFKNVFSH